MHNEPRMGDPDCARAFSKAAHPTEQQPDAFVLLRHHNRVKQPPLLRAPAYGSNSSVIAPSGDGSFSSPRACMNVVKRRHAAGSM
jgi:hypothetical protein